MQCDREDQSQVVFPQSELLTSLHGKGSELRMFVPLLLKAAHGGSCCAASSGLPCSDLGEDPGQYSSQSCPFSREGAEGCSFQAPEGKGVLGVSCRAAVPQGVS